MTSRQASATAAGESAHSALFYQRRGHGPIRIVDHEAVASRQNIPGHVDAHLSNTDEADFHSHASISGCPEERPPPPTLKT